MQNARMTHIEYVLWKALALVVLAFIWGIYCGVTGRPLGQGRPDSPSEPQQDLQADETKR